MHRLYAVLLLCLGCASGAPTAYNQSAFRSPPRAPAFNPVEDAPHTFRPGQPRPTVEPQPTPKRYLPQTEETRREAGLWASSSTPLSTPTLAGIALPLPEEAQAHDTMTASHCGGSMDMAIRWSVGDDAIRKLGPRERSCLAALLYRFCAEHLIRNQDSAKAHREAAVRKVAKAFENGACTDDLRDAVDGIASRVTDEWTDKDMHSMRDE